MGRKNTLTDLSDYLSQNPNEIEFGKTTTREEFVKKKPNTLVDVPEVIKKEEAVANLDGVTMAEIARYFHEKAQIEDRSFVDVWMEVLEEGAKVDPLLKNTNAFKVFRNIRRTSFNVVLEGISHIIKNKK